MNKKYAITAAIEATVAVAAAAVTVWMVVMALQWAPLDRSSYGLFISSAVAYMAIAVGMAWCASANWGKWRHAVAKRPKDSRPPDDAP